jgi:hypothetical protein
VVDPRPYDGGTYAMPLVAGVDATPPTEGVELAVLEPLAVLREEAVF